MRLPKLCELIGVVLLGSIWAWSQINPDLEQGMRPYGSYHGGDLDHVSLSNGNLFFHANLMSYSQRGGNLGYSIALQYNSENFSLFQTPNCPQGVSPGTQGCPIYTIFGPPWMLNNNSLGNAVTIGIEGGSLAPVGFDGIPVAVGSSSTGPGINTGMTFDGNPIYVQTYSVLSPDGALHPLANTNGGAMVLDGSGYSTPNGRSLTDEHGTRFNNVIEDANGNQINLNSNMDSVGRNIPAMPGPSYPAATPGASTASLSACPALGYSFQAVSYAYAWNLPTTNGGTLPLTLCYASVYVRTGGANGPGWFDVHQTFVMLQSVVFPDSTFWAFAYDAADPNNVSSIGLADLVKVTLPTGGSISYTWVACSCSTTFGRSVRTRSLDANDGNGPETWHYSYGSRSTVTDPLGNDTVHTLTGLGGFQTPYETQVQYFQGPQSSGTLLKTVQTDYQFTANPWDAGVIAASGTLANSNSVTNVFPIRVTTTLPNGLVSKVETDYDNALAYHGPLDGITSNSLQCNNAGCQYGAQTTMPVTNYTGSYGKVVAEREYDWGQGAPGLLLRQTKTSYLWQSNSSYLNNNFLDLVSSITVLDGAGNQVAQTTYGYDEYSLNSSGISTQHNSSPVNGSIRGNQTSVHRWLNGSASSTANCSTSVNNGFLVSYAQYNDTGTAYQSTDACGTAAGDRNHTTTHAYDAAYAGAYPTRTCNPLGQCASGVYDFNTGLLTSLTDANNQTTTYSYDNRWRMTQALFPVADSSGVHPETDFNYPDLITVQRTRKQTGSAGIVDYAYLDGLGRTKQTRLVDPEGDDFVDTTYDPLGRVRTVSNPHRSASSSADGITTTYYDALGRVVQVAGPDGTLVPSGTAVTQCQSNNLCSDYSNFPAVTVTDQAGRQRRSRSDALGRLVEVDELGGSLVGSQADGVLAINGPLRYQPGVGATPAAPGTGNVGISGAESSTTYDPCVVQDGSNCPMNYFDLGIVYIAVNGYTDYTFYGEGSTPTSVASGLAAAINSDGSAFVNASAANGVLSLTARQPGAGSNFGWQVSAQSNDSTGLFDPNGSFANPPYSGTLNGGKDAYPGAAVYDAGTVTVTIGSFTASAPYGQSSNSTAAQVAAALVSTGTTGLNRPGSPVTAVVSGASITLMSNTTGSAGNVAVTASSSPSNAGMFPGGSFSGSVSLSGGQDPAASDQAHPYVTLYTYDALGNLTCSVQKGTDTASFNGCGSASIVWRPRSFTYDSLSRLLTAYNPESGQISYSYDAAGNMLQKTSPAPNQTGAAVQTSSFCYDVLDRVTGKAYSAQGCPLSSAVVTYTYDAGANGVGHLTGVTDQAGSGSYGYDALGRITSEQRTIAGVQKSLSYKYNLDSSISQLSYPSGAVIGYSYTTAGRAGAAQDTANHIIYVSGAGGPPNLAAHAPDGSLTGLVNGYATSFAGIGNSFSYNKRLQPVTMVASAPSQTVFSIGYDFHLGNGNNGNVYGITNNRDSTRNQTFTYDALNRLASAQNAGTDCTQKTLNGGTKYWGNSYSYDVWGNLLGKSVTKCSAENLSVRALENNQLVGYGYDAAGNMIHDASTGNNYTYDRENRITGAAGYTYTYDADGNRVEKSNGGTGTIYWYMSPGIVAESDLSGNLQSEYVFFNGRRTARRDFPGGAVSYYFSDELKTADVITDSAGNIKSESDYYPWGGELSLLNGDSNRYKHNGKERDTETGLDHYGARYYSPSFSRFLTPDWSSVPVPVPYADLSNPQTLNQYAFVHNNPMTILDPDGHCCLDAVVDFTVGALNAWGSDNLAGAGRMEQTTLSGKFGQAIGDLGATVQGALETGVSGAGEVVGGTMDGTVVLAPAGLAVNAVSTAGLIHGSVTTATAGTNFFKDLTGNGGGSKPYEATPENVDKMDKGKAPTGNDGNPVELHHPNGDPNAPAQEMTRTDHRLGSNYKQNHPNTNRQPSRINRQQANQQRQQHWKNAAKKTKEQKSE